MLRSTCIALLALSFVAPAAQAEDIQINKAARENFGLEEPQSAPCFKALHGLDAPCDESGRPCVIKTGESWKSLQTREELRPVAERLKLLDENRFQVPVHLDGQQSRAGLEQRHR